jgi:hypothetical protein
MKTYIIYIGVVVLLLLAIYQPQPIEEGFVGIFGPKTPKKVPFMDMIKAKYTAEELKEWQQTWNGLSLDDKNKQIADWDAIKASEQNKIVATAEKQRDSRATVSNHFGSGT